MAMFDVAIIGSGPAGVSAAITLKIRNKSIIVFGSKNLSGKLEKAHEINNYPGIPQVTGSQLMQKLQEHLLQMKIEITEEQINTCYAMGTHFSLQTKNNEMIDAKVVIICSGVNFGKPYEGEEEFLGRGVSYCATCDAPLYKGKKCIVIGQTVEEEKEAEFLAEVCESVVYIPLYKEKCGLEGKSKIKVVNDKPLRIEGGLKASRLVLENSIIEADGIFILRDAVNPKQLVPGLEMDGNHVAVNRSLETNIKGCFAAGDVTGLPYQYIKAAGEGNVAALSAVKYLG